ncbi:MULTISPECIES: hypothetical protein [Nocardiopsis]|uniref:hypothetical protein n=1 Tax=Nocardiopsis TaxID=2013 RepID=UPI00117F9D0E|nr:MULTISPECIES: hypothetical protein [Nocardiopsis]
MPITYRKGSEGQHSQNLRMYKQVPANKAAATNLTALFAHFCQNHITCVKAAADVEHFTHVCFVPSTKNRSQARHPLEEALASKVRSLRRISVGVNPDVQPDSRSFNSDWFVVQSIPDPQPQTDVLLIDDTWVTGSRAQSVAYQLKRSGARRVVIMVLARQIQPGYGPARPLVERISSVPYDMDICAFHGHGRVGASPEGDG